MANIIQIKSGRSAPPDGALTDSELGFDKNEEALYIGKDGKSIKLNKRLEEKVNNHTNNTNNPHRIYPQQIGAPNGYGINPTTPGHGDQYGYVFSSLGNTYNAYRSDNYYLRVNADNSCHFGTQINNASAINWTELANAKYLKYQSDTDNDETKSEKWLDEILKKMPAYSCKNVALAVYPAVSGSTYYGILSKHDSSDRYAVWFGLTYYSDTKFLIKAKTNGVWGKSRFFSIRQIDTAEAQAVYTAMMTDTLIQQTTKNEIMTLEETYQDNIPKKEITMKEKIENWYNEGLWSTPMIEKAVEKGLITQIEFNQIINKSEEV